MAHGIYITEIVDYVRDIHTIDNSMNPSPLLN